MSELTEGHDVPSVPARPRRCAIYVRTAVEITHGTGLAALDAQRDACAAYIRNQLGGSWIASFEDVGFPGFGVTRPALRLLLADVDAGAIDVVVVSAVDRLSRSHRKRAKLMRRLQDAGVLLVVVGGTVATLYAAEAGPEARGGAAGR